MFYDHLHNQLLDSFCFALWVIGKLFVDLLIKSQDVIDHCIN